MLGATGVAHATQHTRGKNHSSGEAECLGELLWRKESVTPSSATSGVTWPECAMLQSLRVSMEEDTISGSM